MTNLPDPDRYYDDADERAVLGAVLVDNARLDDLVDLLTPEHFRRHHHASVYRGMLELARRNQPIDPLTLRDVLPTIGVHDVSPGSLAGYTDGVPSGLNVVAYATQIRKQHRLRELGRVGHAIVRDAEGGLLEPEVVIENAESELLALGSPGLKGSWVSSDEIVDQLTVTLEDIRTSRGKALHGVLTGFEGLDDVTGGLHKGDLILVGARPSLGKTALALQIAQFAAQTVVVAFFSVEMGVQSLGLRMLAGEAEVDSWRLKKGYSTPLEQHKLTEALNTLASRQFWADESPLVSPAHIRARLRRLQTKVGPVGLVVIDYLQLMAPMPEHRQENKTNQVAGISRALKLMAREFDTPFLVLSQLNRGLERATIKTPSLADLRDSGALEQDADIVLLLHRPEVYEPDKKEFEGVAHLHIAKHRNGSTGVVDLRWAKETTRFYEQAVPA